MVTVSINLVTYIGMGRLKRVLEFLPLTRPDKRSQRTHRANLPSTKKCNKRNI